MSGAGELPPLHRITKDDRGPILVIAAYSWIVVTATVAIVRFTLAWNQRLRFKVDDATFLLGVILVTASSVCVHIATNGGLGKHMNTVDAAGLEKFYKATYTAELIGITAMTAAKTSVVFLSDRVAPRKRGPYYFMLALVAVWAVFSFFATAFRCAHPQPWDLIPSRCSSAAALAYPIIVLNFVTDFVLATWILPTLWKLLMDTDKRITVMVLFGARLIVCCFETVQLISLGRHYRDEDITYAYFGRVLWGLCVMHLSVLLATLPRTNRFIVSLQAMHTSTLLTEFELSRPPNGIPLPMLKPSVDLSTSGGITVVPSEAHTRSRSPSRTSERSRERLVDVPLQLTPSVEQNYTAHVTSTADAQVIYDHRRQLKNVKKYEGNDWKKYMTRSGKNDLNSNASSMFSWNSRASYGERILQTREVTQEVEVVQPKEARWALSKMRRLSRETSHIQTSTTQTLNTQTSKGP